MRAATAHPIMENFRVEAFRAIMQGNPTATAAQLSLGELMLQSHSSYRCAISEPCAPPQLHAGAVGSHSLSVQGHAAVPS